MEVPWDVDHPLLTLELWEDDVLCPTLVEVLSPTEVFSEVPKLSLEPTLWD